MRLIPPTFPTREEDEGEVSNSLSTEQPGGAFYKSEKVAQEKLKSKGLMFLSECFLDDWFHHDNAGTKGICLKSELFGLCRHSFL